jgi:hypothetical protein
MDQLGRINFRGVAREVVSAWKLDEIPTASARAGMLSRRSRGDMTT